MKIDLNFFPDLSVGENYRICPACSAQRKKKNLRCLAIRLRVDGSLVGLCHHCNEVFSSEPSASGRTKWRPKMRRVATSAYSLPNDADLEGRISRALSIWKDAVSIKNTLADRYFNKVRGLSTLALGDLSHAVRWHDGYHCIVALMTDPTTAEPVGIHRTFLDPAGNKKKRLMLAKRGVVRLSPDESVTNGLGLTEGLEDGVAVMSAGWKPIWVACSANGIESFPILSGIDSLNLFTDADEVGIAASRGCARRWRSAGREVQIVTPKAMSVRHG